VRLHKRVNHLTPTERIIYFENNAQRTLCLAVINDTVLRNQARLRRRIVTTFRTKTNRRNNYTKIDDNKARETNRITPDICASQYVRTTKGKEETITERRKTAKLRSPRAPFETSYIFVTHTHDDE